MRRPQREPMSGLPERVTIYEVGPRDGLQNEKTVVPAAVKVEFIRRLEAAGLGTIETTSFVPARWVPQMGDAEEVLGRLGARGARPRAGRCSCPTSAASTAPLELGARRDRDLRQRHRDLRPEEPQPQSSRRRVAMFAPVVERARAEGMWVRAYVSMCFGDPWEGPVPIEQVVDVGRAADGPRLRPAQPRRHDRRRDDRPRAPAARGAGHARHRHRPHRRCTSTTPTGRRWPTPWPRCATASPSSTRRPAGSGGCPYARSATGNLATEDLVWALDGAGVETGVDLDALVETSVWMAGQLGRPSPSRVVKALGGA